jgi:apolipoprotein D and lipocalin family protein
MKIIFPILILVVALFLFSGCASISKPLPTPASVDLDRFMGTWYVLGYTPLLVDEGAHNGIEHYHRAENGAIETTYQFRKESFDGELKTLRPIGRVYNKASNAEWRMQFIWPFQAEYIIMDVSDDYSRTIVAHPNRKYAWIMARTPEISPQAYRKMLDQLENEGFDRNLIIKLPQDWSNESDRLQRLREAGNNGRLETM